MAETVFFPGGRDARGTLDVAGARSASKSANEAGEHAACVVACPPHPQHGGNRTDERLRAVSEALSAEGVDCLRFDYGAWDGGRGERTDALNAVDWAGERYDRIGLFGYSFGGTVALSAAAHGADVEAISALAPPARIGTERSDPDAPDDSDLGGIDVVADLEELPTEIPGQVCYGSRDDVADVIPVVEAARERGYQVVEFAADHFFVGQAGTVAADVADFLAPPLHNEYSRLFPPSAANESGARR
jgi:alpha/beta superfamily hydrolase